MIKNWLARWFGGSTRPGQAAPTAQTAPAQEIVVNPPPALDIDLAFYRLLAGATAHAGDAPEQLILDELARLARDPGAAADLVPRVPSVVPQLLRSLRDENMSAADLARQVAQDVTLVAEVIREVNSPYYRPTAPVRTIEGALMLLGQNGLRMLLARVAFRPLISTQGGRLARQVAPQVWSQSEKCALAASSAAPVLGADPFEACLAGLMQNVGLIVAFRLVDQVSGAAALPQSDAFAAALQDSARTLSARIATQWEFPPPVAKAILEAGRPDAPPLAQALHEGDRLAKLRLLLDVGAAGAQGTAAALDGARRRIFDKLCRDEE
ncbi:HDOD domain-containing protein [Massilia consociata]|uniref:HDOD domain-containing protein n=1 Tax=Massilia consociata TaxID=760117 RepID=A0ABV6FE12_9BURK